MLQTIKLVVASTSSYKLKAVERALAEINLPGVAFHSVPAPSGVNEQPIGHKEIALGVENRLISAEQQHPDAIIVSIENGLDDQGRDFALICVRGPHSGSITTRSGSVQFPSEAINIAAQRGFNTTTVGKVLAERHDCDPADPHSYLTNGKISRVDQLMLPLVNAMRPIIHHELAHMFHGVNTFRIELRGTVIELPIRPLNDKLSGAIYEPHRSRAFAREAAKELAARLVMSGGEIILTPEGKGGGLVFALAEELGLPYEVARKSVKSYMLEPIVKSARDECMTDNDNVQDFFLDATSVQNLSGKRIILFDDVISTGGSIKALKQLCQQIGAQVVVVSSVFTEGTRRPDVISLNHLPLFKS